MRHSGALREDPVLGPEELQLRRERSDPAERPEKEPEDEKRAHGEGRRELERLATGIGWRSREQSVSALDQDPEHEAFADRPAAEPEREKCGGDEPRCAARL